MSDEPGQVEVIERLYGAFSRGDADTMATCYHPDVHFSDPVFTDLNGPEVMKMWRTLLTRSDDLEIVLGQHGAEGETGFAHWTARYTFSQTGREVVNEVDAEFRFRNGLIADHRDSFDFWKWSRMALGTPGLLLGWSPIVKNKVREQSRQLLASRD
jgi:ketosteroid isomerase-like protein